MCGYCQYATDIRPDAGESSFRYVWTRCAWSQRVLLSIYPQRPPNPSSRKRMIQLSVEAHLSLNTSYHCPSSHGWGSMSMLPVLSSSGPLGFGGIQIVIFLIVYLNIYMLFSGESVVRWPTGSLPVKLTHGQASSKCLAFLSARSSAKISLLWTNDGGWNVAQLLEHWTVTLWIQVRFHSAASFFFFSPSQLSVQTLFRCPYTSVSNCMH